MKTLIIDNKEVYLDDKDYENISKFTWRLCNGYARCADGRYMHSLILTNDYLTLNIDHINNNKLDNQSHNLRLVTESQNIINRGKNKNNFSGYKGVFLVKSTGKWRAQVTKDRKVYNLGSFTTVEEAALAYNKKTKELHGKFAKLNIIPNQNPNIQFA